MILIFTRYEIGHNFPCIVFHIVLQKTIQTFNLKWNFEVEKKCGEIKSRSSKGFPDPMRLSRLSELLVDGKTCSICEICIDIGIAGHMGIEKEIVVVEKTNHAIP